MSEIFGTGYWHMMVVRSYTVLGHTNNQILCRAVRRHAHKPRSLFRGENLATTNVIIIFRFNDRSATNLVYYQVTA